MRLHSTSIVGYAWFLNYTCTIDFIHDNQEPETHTHTHTHTHQLCAFLGYDYSLECKWWSLASNLSCVYILKPVYMARVCIGRQTWTQLDTPNAASRRNSFDTPTLAGVNILVLLKRPSVWEDEEGDVEEGIICIDFCLCSSFVFLFFFWGEWVGERWAFVLLWTKSGWWWWWWCLLLWCCGGGVVVVVVVELFLICLLFYCICMCHCFVSVFLCVCCVSYLIVFFFFI